MGRFFKMIVHYIKMAVIVLKKPIGDWASFRPAFIMARKSILAQNLCWCTKIWIAIDGYKSSALVLDVLKSPWQRQRVLQRIWHNSVSKLQ